MFKKLGIIMVLSLLVFINESVVVSLYCPVRDAKLYILEFKDVPETDDRQGCPRDGWQRRKAQADVPET